MRLESNVLIHRPPEDVARYLGGIGNISKWDRGVAGARQVSAESVGVGYEFETLTKDGLDDPASDQGRMSYRISEIAPNYTVVALTNSDGNARFFKRAEWRFQLAPSGEGTQVICAVDFALRWQYMFLGPLLYAKRNAIRMDLESLKRALEEPART
jgi:Polyketide cyclase / dehydrase and lipid transport